MQEQDVVAEKNVLLNCVASSLDPSDITVQMKGVKSMKEQHYVCCYADGEVFLENLDNERGIKWLL